MKLNRLSTSPFLADRIISQLSLSKSCRAPLLFAGVHFIFLRDSLPRVRGTEAWRDWVLWYESCPCISPVLPGLAPARCSRLPPTPDISSGFDVSSSLFGCCTSYHKCICSKLVGHSCSLPLNPSCWGSLPPNSRHPRGYCEFRFVVASFLVAPHRACNLGS